MAFLERASGVFFWIFLTMIVSSCLLPLSLFVKKIGINKWIILFISFLINFGFWFEKYVIIVTSLHGDKIYGRETSNYIYFNTLTIGFAITLILIGINLWYYFRKSNVDSKLIDS
ncbi:MAG: hypothetical protein P8N07_00755 [Flavobacteriales bacterium]|nr:hypothetical protein [Flavobacteriales bacterium]